METFFPGVPNQVGKFKGISGGWGVWQAALGMEIPGRGRGRGRGRWGVQSKIAQDIQSGGSTLT